uniref:JmjC domain-containing protein n=1 Tax=Tanacetum cinerariifolium TaxID=118510 RepID=A0A699K529_TANCI|nr:JmjC domain-containing protein [Tanacetum cinerariifolium]
MDGMLGNVGSKRHKCLMYRRFLQMILGIQTTDPFPRPTFDFTAKLFSNMKLNWDGPHMPLLAPMLVVSAGGDAANVAAGPGPSSAPQVQPKREHSPVWEHSSVREPYLPPSPPPSSAEVGPTTSSRPPSPSRPPSGPADIHEGGSDFASCPSSNEAPQTPAVTTAGGAEDFAALTALTLKLDKCLHRVTTLENELGITKKVLGGAVLKLVTRVKRLEGLLQQRKRRLVLSDSEGDDATTMEQEFDFLALHTLASVTLGDDPSATAVGPDVETTMPGERISTTRRRLRKPFTSSVSAHVSETIPPGVRVPAAATTIPTGSSVDAAVHAAAALSFSIPTAADKGKAPMVDNSPPADLLSEHECVLKNLHDSQLGEELAKKIQAEQEAEFARQQEEFAQKAQAESVASPTAHGQGMSDQRRQELDAAQLIYTEADWLDLLAKIATNSALSKQLLGDDVTEENMNKRLGMLLMRKRRELAEQSRVKPMTKTLQRDYMRDFVKNCSASVYNQGLTMKKPTLDAPPAKRANQEAPQVPTVSTQDHAGVPAAPSIPAAFSCDPSAILVPAISIAHVTIFVPAEPMVHPAKSLIDPPLTAPAHGSFDPTVAVPTPSSLRHRRKHIAKKRVTPIVDVADAAMIKFDSDSDSDDDPLPYAPYAGWEMVPSHLGSIHAYHNMEGHTKHFTTLREILHMGDLHVLFQSLDDMDALHFWHTQDSWRIRSWRLYPQAQVYVLEMVDGWVIHMFVDVSYPLSVSTLERMLKHGLEVSKLLVGGDLTMAEQLIGFIKAAILNAKSAA